MKKIIIGTLLAVVGLTALAGIYRFSVPDGDDISPGGNTSRMTEPEARVIAERSCIKGGEALAFGVYNENTKTWWFEANLNATREGCNPACVVSEDAGTAEINWRCTGVVPPPTSGVRGRVLLGPTCPVERIPRDPGCAERPYATTIQVIVVGSPQSAPYATVKSDADGRYSIVLPPGTYALQPMGGQTLPRCETKEVTIVSGAILEEDLSCDTGIR